MKHSAPVLVADLTRLHDLPGEANGKGMDRVDVRKRMMKNDT